MSYKESLKAVTMVTTNSNLLSPVYICLNPLGLPENCVRVIIINASNTGFVLSLDGGVAHDFVMNGTQREFNVISSETGRLVVPRFKKGQKFWASAAGAGAGNIYVVGYYQEPI